MIHPTTVAHPDVTIGHNVTIEPFCVLGSDHGPLHIPDDSVIRSHTVIEGGVSIVGEQLETGHYALIRAGNAIGDNLRIGSYSSLEGGAVIGDFVRIHGRVEMTHARLADFARIHGGTYLTDNRLPPGPEVAAPSVGACAVICMNVVVLAGIKIGAHAYVGAQQLVSHDVAPCQFLTPGYESRRYIFGRRWQGQMLPWVYNEQVTSTYPSRAQAELQRHAELVDVMREART